MAYLNAARKYKTNIQYIIVGKNVMTILKTL